MATNFPTSLDNLTNPAGSDPVNNPSHATQHANINDAIEVLETKVGVNNSTVTSSLDYRVRSLETTPTYTNEMAQDAVAAALAAGTHTNITINYNDTGNSISISAAAGYTNEEAVDAVAAALTAGSGISISYNDAANTITISVDSTIATKTYVDTAVSNLGSTAANTYVLQSEVGNPDGIATLDGNGFIPDAQIPAGIARDSEVSSAISTEVTNRNSAISTAVNNLINSAPGTLDTLGEIATALAADESAAAALTTVVNSKAPLASPTFTGTVSGITKSMVGLGSVDNTSDSAKPISIATQTALDAKLTSATAATTYAPIASPTFTGTVGGITKSMVGLGSVDNTADTAKPISTATQTALDGKVSKAGGDIITSSLSSVIPLVIRGAASQAANLQEWQTSGGTAQSKIDQYGQIVSSVSSYLSTLYVGGGISGSIGQANVNPFSASTIGLVVRGAASQAANLQEWQNSTGTLLSKVDSSGAMFTITPADSTNTTQVATTAYVKSNINNLINSAPGTFDTLSEIAAALNNDPNFYSTITTLTTALSGQDTYSLMGVF